MHRTAPHARALQVELLDHDHHALEWDYHPLYSSLGAWRDTMPRGISCRAGCRAARDVVPRGMSCGTAVASGEIERVRNVDLSSFNPDAFGELVCASWDAVFPERVLFECGATAR